MDWRPARVADSLYYYSNWFLDKNEVQENRIPLTTLTANSHTIENNGLSFLLAAWVFFLFKRTRHTQPQLFG